MRRWECIFKVIDFFTEIIKEGNTFVIGRHPVKIDVLKQIE